jgi:hypothetical protein
MPDRLFHYTTRDFAVECAADLDAGRPVIVEVWDGLYGPGFYALDVGFDDATRDQLRWECFGDARSEHPMDGVLVIDPSLADVPFEPMDGHISLMEASWGSRTPIEGMIVAVGVWEDGEWQIDEYE